MSGEAKFFTKIDHNMGLLCVKRSALAFIRNSNFLEKKQRKTVEIILRSTKNAQLRASILTHWRLLRLTSQFKIHSKGKNPNGHT